MKYNIIPKNRFARVTIGILLLIGGLLGFLPILGFWMFPLGIFILSADFPAFRKLRRKFDVFWGKKKKNIERVK